MVSIFEYTRSPVTIHIFHDDTLTQENKQKFLRTAEKYSQSVNFIDITKYKAFINEKLEKMSEKYTIGTLFRMFMPDELPDLDKVIYLDVDLLVSLDIRELWDIDLENKSIAGVLDKSLCKLKPFSFSWRANQIKFINCRMDSYINAGVVIMNLRKIRESGSLVDKSINWFKRYGHFAYTADQDALNSIFLDDIKFIDNKFNTSDLNIDIKDCIFHACTKGLHPWDSFRNRKHDIFFWAMYRKSAWGEALSIEEFVQTIGNVVINTEFFHLHGKSCVKRIIKAMYNRICLIKEPFRVIHVLLIGMFNRK